VNLTIVNFVVDIEFGGVIVKVVILLFKCVFDNVFIILSR